VDLDTATAAELDQLPGIGPVLAARIVEHRRIHGRFRHVDELLSVPGIGPRLLERLRPRLREPAP
jgi:competence protein ComEA